MPENPAQEYLKSLHDKHEERERLRGAVYSEIVEAGRGAGYNFTEDDLKALTLSQAMRCFWA